MSKQVAGCRQEVTDLDPVGCAAAGGGSMNGSVVRSLPPLPGGKSRIIMQGP